MDRTIRASAFTFIFISTCFSASVKAEDADRTVKPSAENVGPKAAENVPEKTPENTRVPASDTEAVYDPPNYRLLSWVNVFVPGFGQFWTGHYAMGALQAGLEISSFATGYWYSKKSPMTLDGVPEVIPSLHRKRARKSSASIVKPLFADWAQEFGLKYHMVNVYDIYRMSAPYGKHGSEIDLTPASDLFLAPFRFKNLSDPWVLIPLVASLGAVIIDYKSSTKTAIPHLTTGSNIAYGITYAGVFPVGSAVPEEMFYRGFFQHEIYEMTGTPWVAIPLSTGFYALSHQAGIDQVVAAITGLYLGILTHERHGQLTPGITFHFWSDVIAGIEAILINQSTQQPTRQATLSFNLDF